MSQACTTRAWMSQSLLYLRTVCALRGSLGPLHSIDLLTAYANVVLIVSETGDTTWRGTVISSPHKPMRMPGLRDLIRCISRSLSTLAVHVFGRIGSSSTCARGCLPVRHPSICRRCKEEPRATDPKRHLHARDDL